MNDPHLPVDLDDQHHCRRFTQMLGFQILRAEYALSPDGQLRSWMLINLRLMALGLIPLLTIVPVLTISLAQATAITTLLVTVLANLLVSLLLLIAIVGILALLLMRLAGRRRHRNQDDF